MANNTVRLVKSVMRYDARKNDFEKGDAIWNVDACDFDLEELKRWKIENEDEAKEELSRHRCTYDIRSAGNILYVTEYGLEWFEADEEGEYMSGADYDLAPTDPEHDDLTKQANLGR